MKLPDSVTSIAADAFTGSNIQAVTIPKGVTSIGVQSNWTPDIVYGYTGSQAETWADENNYIFEALDQKQPTEDPGEDPSDNTETENPRDDTETEDPGDGGDNNNGNGKAWGNGTTTVSGTGAPTVTAAAPHIKDATPKTGVEDYGIYFLFGAILLVGGACFAYSKKLHCEK